MPDCFDTLIALLRWDRSPTANRPLITGLRACRLPGTSHTEQGITVSLSRENSEDIAFFNTDSASFRSPLQLSHEKACDLLVVVMNTRTARLLFVEMTSGDFSKCEDQLESVIKTLHQASTATAWQELRQRTALIVASASVPRGRKSKTKFFQEQYGVILEIKSGIKKSKTLSLRPYCR